MEPLMSSQTSARCFRKRVAFTLTEILVVILVIVTLAGTLLPVILKAQNQARRTRAAADLQAIGTGLEAFKAQFGYYPEVTGGNAAKSLADSLLKPVPVRPNSTKT